MKLKDLNKRKIVKEFIKLGAKSLPSGKLDRITYNKRFFNVKEVAEYLNISEKTIYNKLSLKTFPIKAKRLGRKTILFEITDVVRYADSLR
jgi:excisionase family DNA binding protein